MRARLRNSKPFGHSVDLFKAQRFKPTTVRFPTHLFRRVTSSGQFLAELDGLRFLAIVPVVLFHATLSLYLKRSVDQVSITGSDIFHSPLGWVISHGFLGVQLFFVISGFVVTLPFAKHFLLGERKPSLRAFFIKRVTRIEPPYVIALVLFAIGVLAIAPQNFRLADFLTGLVYLRTAVFGDSPWAFFISWSLEIEVQFYVLAPFLATIFAVRNSKIRRAALVSAIIVFAAYAGHIRLMSAEVEPLPGPLQHGMWLGTEIAFFLVGLLVADLWVMRECRLNTRISSIAYDLAFLAGIVGVYASYWVLAASPIAPAFAGMVVLAASLLAMMLGGLRGCIARKLLSIPLITAIGGACYTIYLLHFIFVSSIGRFIPAFTTETFELNVLLFAVPFAAAIIFACLALFPFVERPFMYGNWPQVLWRAVKTKNPRVLTELF